MNNGLSSLNPSTCNLAFHSHLDAFTFLPPPALCLSDTCLYQSCCPITSSLLFCKLSRRVQECGLSSSIYCQDHGVCFTCVSVDKGISRMPVAPGRGTATVTPDLLLWRWPAQKSCSNFRFVGLVASWFSEMGFNCWSLWVNSSAPQMGLSYEG